MARRAATNSSLEAEAKARTRTQTLPYEVSTGRVQDRFPAYEDFRWEKIEAFLKGKWPHWTDFKEAHVSSAPLARTAQLSTELLTIMQVGDSWVFEIPEKLNEVSRY